MTMIRKMIRAAITPVGADEVDVVMSTAALARDGHVLVPQGCQLASYRANPIVLWQHSADHPIGNADNIAVSADKITARIRFAPLGISAKADEIRGLMKSGVVRAVSVGFDPIYMQPLDPKKPRGGQRIAAWDLLELSVVSVPSDTGAMVTARSDNAATELIDAENAAQRRRDTDVLALAAPPITDDQWRRLREVELFELSPALIEGGSISFAERQRDVANLRLAAR